MIQLTEMCSQEITEDKEAVIQVIYWRKGPCIYRPFVFRFFISW